MTKQNNQKVFSERYNQAYLLCAKLLSNKLQAMGKEDHSLDHNLIQSVLASIPVIDLIMGQDFQVSVYKAVLISAIEETRKELFPDLAKKRFISLDKIADPLIQPESKALLEMTDSREQENSLILRGLPQKSKVYIEKIIENNAQGTQHLQLKNNRQLLKKVSLIAQLFPDHKVPFVQEFWNNAKLTEIQIIDIYKCVLSGIEKNFPTHFLKTQAKFKAKILLRYLFTDILNITDPNMLITMDKELLDEYKLTNILRYFNYSVKQLMLNAFPEKYTRWQGGKTTNNFWENHQNRISAIRWLVEKKLSIDVTNSAKIQLNKKDFSKYGLSYLFNHYYNSVSRALNDAYPALLPWQVSALPATYWDTGNTKEAIFWMINKLGWKVFELPAKYNNRQLNRTTFSQFGLSGLYESKFNCNIYKLVHFIWPGKFKEWEFGNMPVNFWKSAENRRKFSQWFAEKFNINMLREQSSFASLEEAKEYRFYTSLYKYCHGDFNRLLKAYALDLAEQNKSRLLLRKCEGLIQREKLSILQSILSYGLFYNMVKIHAHQRIDSFKRMKTRMEKRI